jgi:PTS system cellobiose-specific IIB component
MRSVLVVCAAGVSSTMLASAMRARAAERGIALRVEPVDESRLSGRLPDAHALLVGPNLAARFDSLRDQAAEHGVVAVLLSGGHVGADAAESALVTALAALADAPADSDPAPARTTTVPIRTE